MLLLWGREVTHRRLVVRATPARGSSRIRSKRAGLFGGADGGGGVPALELGGRHGHAAFPAYTLTPAMSGRTILTQPGDTMVSIAHANGYRSWKGIYGHPENASLRESCPDPAVLRPGEKVFLPDKGTAEWVCATGRRHVFRTKTLEARLRFSVGDEERVFANAPYEITIDGDKRTGTTDGDGVIDLKVPPDADQAHVLVWPEGAAEPWEWTARIGHLDPMDSDTGMRGRLANLGYPVGGGASGLRETLERFQLDMGLDVTGVADGPTIARLQELSGT